MERQDRRKICRYYAKGRCVKQDCPFIHQQETKKPCKFFSQSGYCRKGKNCQFYHATQEEVKKDKKFVDKKLQQQKIPLKSNTQKNEKDKQKQPNSIINKIMQNQQKQYQQMKNLKQVSIIDYLLEIPSSIPLKTQNKNETLEQEQLIKQLNEQLQKFESCHKGYEKLQFKMLYPHSFLDSNKTLQKKEYIKSVEMKYFGQKSFLQVISCFNQETQKHKIEYYQILRRYQDSFQLQNQQQPNIYIIKLRPILYGKETTLLFKITQLEQKITIQINQIQYPQVKATFQVLNQSIPIPYKTKFNQFLHKFHTKNTIFQTLKYLQNHFEKIYQQIRDKLETEHFKKLQLKKKIEGESQKLIENKNKLQQRQKQKCSKKQEKQKAQLNLKQNIKDQKQFESSRKIVEINNKRVIKKQENKNQSEKVIKEYREYIELEFSGFDKPQHQNLNDEITVESIHMQNCPYLVIEKLLLYIQCDCSKKIMYLFDACERKQLKLCIKLKCKKCNDCMRIVWQREVIQLKSTLISRMSISNGGLGWKIGCQCDQEIIKNKLYLPGERLQINCHSCFQNMNILYNGIKFFNPFVKEFQMQEEKQLPIKGTCNHQKLDFKWTRYACCGRPFPCDQCHTLGSIKNHQIFQGVTMICGHCSFQQSIGTDCCKCKKQLLKGVDKAGHWQGGMGCRDKNLLSKKDAKKYNGISKAVKQKK